MRHRNQIQIFSRLLLILIISSSLISCTQPHETSKEMSPPKYENRDTSCSYFYFLWGTHEEFYHRYTDALEAYQNALICDPSDTYIKKKLPLLYLKMGSLNKAVDLLKQHLEEYPDDISQRALLARIFIQQKKEPEAIAQYRIITTSNPEDRQALLRLGILLSQKGDLQQAADYFNTLLEVDEEAYFARLYLARIADQLGNNNEAEKHYVAALELNFSSDLAYEIGEFYLRNKGYEKTIEIMRELLSQDDTEERARFTIVQALLALEREDEAIAELGVARDVSRDPEKISLLLSRLYLKNGNNEKAIENLESILEMKENSEAQYLLAIIYMEAEQWQDALKMLEAIHPASEEFEDGVVLQSRIYHQTKQTAKALQLLQRYLDNPETRKEMFYILASSLYQENGQSSQATNLLATGITIFADSEKLLFEYGLQLERTDQLDKAIEVMERILQQNPDHPEALNFVGYSWADSDRNLEQALSYIQRAMELKPGNGYIQDSLGWVQFKLGNFKEAQRELSEALKLVPDDPHIYDHLGDVYMALNLPDKALDAYKSALRYFEDQDKKTRVQQKIEILTSP